MDSSKPGLDLEKELTCSICTELLYHPLTLLDCLHTFCGACLKEWFDWQANSAKNAPSPPAPGSPVFTCPSCRAPVRDTRHNSTVQSLLDMILVAHPEKAKPESEKGEMDAKYRPGDKVLPELDLQRTAEQLRLEEQERSLIDSVRQVSLLEVVSGGSSSSRSRRHGDEGRSRNGSSRRTRDTSSSRDNRAHETQDRDRDRDRDRAHRRQDTEGETSRRVEQLNTLSPEGPESTSDRSRNSSSGYRQRRDESLERQRRHIEHQSSLRSLISSSDAADIDMEREVEEFARQIQEEGLLDGLDLDNIDLTNNDELSRKITEAYRRRQRERERRRYEARERSRASSRHSYTGPSDMTSRLRASSTSNSRQTNCHSRTPSATSQSEERSRHPPSSSANHLEVYEPRRRRRATSGSRDRSATLPVVSTQPEIRVEARSQTDLEPRSNSMTTSTQRPSIVEERSASTPNVPSRNRNIVESPSPAVLPFSARASGLDIAQPQEHITPETSRGVRPRPTDIVVEPPAASAARLTQSGQGLLPSPRFLPAHHNHRSATYEEPSVTCNWCGKEAIEYELHYNCAECHDGNWNICLSCYRLGKGCLHWFGFGLGGWNKWERQRKTNPSLPEPHKLLASRFLPPKGTFAANGEDRKARSTENPFERLQSGTFCALCLVWTNECYWGCDICNDGDWGFCNDCVNQGRSCTHALLPLAHQHVVQQTASTPTSPRSPSHPSSATMMVGLNATSIGQFKVMTFITTCDVCRKPIAPTQSRFHCFACVSSIVPNSNPGDYDICESCYNGLVSKKAISPENGPTGWRRCLQGHRMVVVGFENNKGGQKRYTVQDVVGGRRLQVEDVPGEAGLERWVWYEDNTKRERLVTEDVSKTAAQNTGASGSDVFPPDGGLGWRAFARWAWYPAPGAYDELLFPKGAEITEIEDANGEWYHGAYMGAKGLFPAPYVTLLE